MTGHGQAGQVFEVPGGERIPLQGPGGSRQLSETGTPSGDDPLCDGMIVIAANGGGGVGLDPFDAGNWVRPVIDQIAQKQAGVEGLANGRQGGPVGVDVGQNQDFHERCFVYSGQRVTSNRPACSLTIPRTIVSNEQHGFPDEGDHGRPSDRATDPSRHVFETEWLIRELD